MCTQSQSELFDSTNVAKKLTLEMGHWQNQRLYGGQFGPQYVETLQLKRNKRNG